MSYSPKFRLPADNSAQSDHFSKNEKMRTGHTSYRCANYIQALVFKENLETITGEAYDIEKNGRDGWKVAAARNAGTINDEKQAT